MISWGSAAARHKPYGAFRAVLAMGLAVLLFLAAGIASAQQFRFNNVSVEGNQRIEAATILTFAGITRGEAVSAGELNDAAQRIRASGLFESVEVIPQGGTLVIRVVEFPTINRIAFEGNRRLSDDDLAGIIRSEPRRVYSPSVAEQDTAIITEAYAQQGRISATVTPRIIRRSDNRVDLVFEIFEGGLTEIERISFVGNTEFSDRRLRRVLETTQAGLFRQVVGRDTFIADRVQFDQQLLTDFYRSRGYVDFEIQNVDVSLTRERDAFLITFNVREGQRFEFGDITVRSEIAEVDEDVYLDLVRLRRGVTFNPERIDADIARLEVQALRDGLNFVRVEPRVTRDDRALELDVEFVVSRGPRVFVERIDIEGNTTTLDRVIRRQFRTVEGDPFNPREIRAAAQRIRALGYFAESDVETREGSSPDQVIVDVDVEEQPTGSLSFGASFSSDSGLGFAASLAERNFLGRGQLLEVGISTAESNRRLNFQFAEPNFLGRDLRFGVSLGYTTTDNENALYDTETLRFSPSLTFPVSENGRLALRYTLEAQDLFDVQGEREDDPDDRASLLVFDEADDGLLVSSALGYTYSYDNRRSGFDPETGIVLRFGQDFAGLGGDQRFIRTTFLAAAERETFGGDVTLRATFEGGTLTFLEDESRVTDRFFLGGRTMRGFEAGGIGPRDADTDDALGGNTFAVIRLESEFPLPLPDEYGVSGGAFFDYGSVWDVGKERDDVEILYDDFTPRAVVGLAVFWTTPIGPLRFNFTEALIKEDEDEDRSFDITIQSRF
ncbi:outer membrane protein assembly factor BamA [Aestuariibius sp. 2305UL40-4]|uniref:outer membrane protein assembly factor BamA n=1 Tax=Aestuariibius violaceus TaxID=3234132 RepID=UPI00398EC59F